MMTDKQFADLTDEELKIEKKKLQQAKMLHAGFIGFLAGILIFGIVAWSLSPEKKLGFLIPISIPIVLIYKLVKQPNTNKALEDVLKERKL
jgi:cobalamin biosynthesis protein CobD/CbiB